MRNNGVGWNKAVVISNSECDPELCNSQRQVIGNNKDNTTCINSSYSLGGRLGDALKMLNCITCFKYRTGLQENYLFHASRRVRELFISKNTPATPRPGYLMVAPLWNDRLAWPQEVWFWVSILQISKARNANRSTLFSFTRRRLCHFFASSPWTTKYVMDSSSSVLLCRLFQWPWFITVPHNVKTIFLPFWDFNKSCNCCMNYKKQNFFTRNTFFSTLYWGIGLLLLFIHYISCLYHNMYI